jgi:hypothetical protein
MGEAGYSEGVPASFLLLTPTVWSFGRIRNPTDILFLPSNQEGGR